MNLWGIAVILIYRFLHFWEQELETEKQTLTYFAQRHLSKFTALSPAKHK